MDKASLLRSIIMERKSSRVFDRSCSIPEKTIMNIVSTALQAPTACNRQLWKFIVFNARQFKAQGLLRHCPNIATVDPGYIVLALYDTRYNPEHAANAQSVGAAIQNMLLTATTMSIGSLWMVGFGDEKACKKILKIPAHMHILAAVLFGISKDDHAPASRRPAETVINVGKYVPAVHESLPVSFDPRRWSFAQLQSYLGCSIWAKSPWPRFYRPYFQNEQRLEIDAMPALHGSVLAFGPFSGGYLIDMAMKAPECTWTTAAYHAEINSFIKDKLRNMQLSDRIKVRYDTCEEYRLHARNGTFNTVTCFHQMERFPKAGPWIKEFHRALKTDGTLILSISNRYSLYYLMYRIRQWLLREKVGLRGPFRPCSPLSIWWSLRRHFKVQRVIGITLIPFIPGISHILWGACLSFFCKKVMFICQKK